MTQQKNNLFALVILCLSVMPLHAGKAEADDFSDSYAGFTVEGINLSMSLAATEERLLANGYQRKRVNSWVLKDGKRRSNRVNLKFKDGEMTSILISKRAKRSEQFDFMDEARSIESTFADTVGGCSITGEKANCKFSTDQRNPVHQIYIRFSPRAKKYRITYSPTVVKAKQRAEAQEKRSEAQHEANEKRKEAQREAREKELKARQLDSSKSSLITAHRREAPMSAREKRDRIIRPALYATKFKDLPIETQQAVEESWEKGSDLYRNGKYVAAEKVFTEGLMLHDSNVKLLAARGWSRANTNKLIESFKDFSRASKIDPKALEPHIGLAELDKARGRHDSAIREYTKAINIDPTDPKLYYARGVTRYYHRLAERERRYPAWYIKSHLGKGDRAFEGAVSDLTKAIELKSDYGEAYAARAPAHVAFNHTGPGNKFSDSDRAIELMPDNPETYFVKAVVYSKVLDGLKTAIPAARKALAMDPGNPKYIRTIEMLNKMDSRKDDRHLTGSDILLGILLLGIVTSGSSEEVGSDSQAQKRAANRRVVDEIERERQRQAAQKRHTDFIMDGVMSVGD